MLPGTIITVLALLLLASLYAQVSQPASAAQERSRVAPLETRVAIQATVIAATKAHKP